MNDKPTQYGCNSIFLELIIQKSQSKNQTNYFAQKIYNSSSIQKNNSKDFNPQQAKKMKKNSLQKNDNNNIKGYCLILRKKNKSYYQQMVTLNQLQEQDGDFQSIIRICKVATEQKDFFNILLSVEHQDFLDQKQVTLL